MGPAVHWANVVAQAATTALASRAKMFAAYLAAISAIADAEPVRFFLTSSATEPRQHDQAPESLACEVVESPMVRKGGRIVDTAHAGLLSRSGVIGRIGRYQRSVRPLLTASLYLALASPAAAQVELRADIFRLNTGPCRERSGSGTPEAAVTGNVCDVFRRTDTGQVYFKISGSGNTGWITWDTTATANSIVSRNGAGSTAVADLLATQVYDAALTSGRVTLAAASGQLVDDSDLTFAGDTLSVPKLSAPASLLLNPAGDLITDPAGNDILPVTNYDINIGSAPLKYLSLSVGELLAETLVAQDVISTIGGRVLVAPTTVLTSDAGTGATSIVVKHNQMANGDRVYLASAPGGVPQVEWMAITSGPSGGGPYTYSVTRNLDGSGANQWYAGDAVLNTGTTGKGFIDLYSLSGVLSGSGPTIVGNIRTGTTYNNIAARWAIGNLNELFGYVTEVYGVAMGDPSATNITIDATNGFRIRSGTTNKLVANTSGDLSLVGDLSIGTSGHIRSGATSWTTGAGYWFGNNAGTVEARIGDLSSQFISWSDGGEISMRAGHLTVNVSGGTTNDPASSSFSTSRGYKFDDTLYPAQGPFWGMFALDVASSGRYLSIANVIDASDGATYSAVTETNASNGTRSAVLTLTATPSGGTNATSAVLDVDTLTINGIGTHTITGGANSAQTLSIVNTTSNTTAASVVSLSAGTTSGWLNAYSQGYSTNSGNIASTLQLWTSSSGGIVTVAANASGMHRWYNVTTEVMRIHASGGVAIGTTLDPGAGQLAIANGLVVTAAAGGGSNRNLCIDNSGVVYAGTPGC